MKRLPRDGSDANEDMEKAKFASRSEAGRYAAHIRWARENGQEPLTPDEWRARQSGATVVAPPPPEPQPTMTALDRAKQMLASPEIRELIDAAKDLASSQAVDPTAAEGIGSMIPSMVATHAFGADRKFWLDGLRMSAGSVKLIEDVEAVGKLVSDIVDERMIARFGSADPQKIIDQNKAEAEKLYDELQEIDRQFISPQVNSANERRLWERQTYGERYGNLMDEWSSVEGTSESRMAAYREAQQIKKGLQDAAFIQKVGVTREEAFDRLWDARKKATTEVVSGHAEIIREVLRELVPMGGVTPLVHGAKAADFKKLIMDVFPSKVIEEVNAMAKLRSKNGKGITLTKSTGGGHWQRLSTVGKTVGPKILADESEDTRIHEFTHAIVEYSPMFAALDNLAWNYRRLGAYKADRSTTTYLDRAMRPAEGVAPGVYTSASRVQDEYPEPYAGNRYSDGVHSAGFSFSPAGSKSLWNNSELSTISSSILGRDKWRTGIWADKNLVNMFLGTLVLAGMQ